MKFRDVIRILRDHDFIIDRQSGSHHQYKGKAGGQPRLVTLAYSSENEDIRPKTLASIMRQSGLPKQLFR